MRFLFRYFVPVIILLSFPSALAAQNAKTQVAASIDAHRAAYSEMAMAIWQAAEVGHQEYQSSGVLINELKQAGFSVQTAVAEMPTAFVASWGQGRPVVGILAEFDALPGLSQQAVPERKAVEGKDAGHACGHHLLGTASTAAGIAVKNWLATSGRSGTVRVYGTPAEEGGGGKVYMVKAGLFNDVDIVLAWHPGDDNSAAPSTTLANITAKFRFRGVSAHAAGAPDQGRSALDGVEAMNYMVNLMREHVPSSTRIHYVITDGGRAPNVVPDFAEVYYYARHPDSRVLQEIWARIIKASEGAAAGTGTSVEHELINGVYSVLPNQAIGKLMDSNLREIGGYSYDPSERIFAETLQKALAAPGSLTATQTVQPFVPGVTSASSDVGDVSWVVPTAQISTATWVPGTPAHSWQAVAAGGTSIGIKGMMVAAKTIAATAVDLFSDPSHIREAQAEFQRARGPNFRYQSFVGDRKPPLDYRTRQQD
jgi:aminobenzoyl-glutamate utilization protein B